MHKLLERTRKVIEAFDKQFTLHAKIELGDEGGVGQSLEIDGWITACIELRQIKESLSNKKHPHIVLYIATYYPAGRWEPESVDVNYYMATMSPTEAAKHIANLIIDNTMNGMLESLQYDFDAEDEPEREQV